MDTKALRQKILDLAIRGKLVPQDPSDEPASVLLEKIREEKARMVKEGNLKKKDIKNDSIIYVGEDNLHYEKFQDGTVKCIEDELPFEVPNNWAWARLRNICMMAAGKAKPANQIKATPFEGGFPCFGGNGIRGYVDEYNQEGTFSIVGRQGALCGNINIASGKFYATEHAVVTTLFAGIDFNWSNYILEALNLNEYSTGAAQPGLSVANVLNVFVPVPPTQEQKRIGQKISKSIKTINIIEQEKQNLQTIIADTKSKVLDLAIRGQLIPQNPDDEPASVLLDRIRAEKEELIKQGKIKRDKKESIIFKGEDNSYYEKLGEDVCCIDEEIPYDIPDSWEWVRLKNCCIKEIRRGKSPKYAVKSNTLVFAQKCNTKYNGIDIGLALYLDESTLGRYPNEEYMHGGDVVVNSTGTGTLGRIGFYRTTDNIPGFPIVPDSHVTVIRGFRSIRAFYLYIFMKANQSVLEKKGEGSTNQKELKPITLKEMLVPMPPASEQQRIENAIITAFSFIETIEKSLN
ncbi:MULTISPECIES: restriction endonuclease subunit S [Lachnospiraceae]|uniref:Restriction endonuclease subunit S n=1 Tax=Blautia parvula TaxID=2877527 RepID=A0ABQ0BPV8_9FIRM